MLLKALANLLADPSRFIPPNTLELVERSRNQANALSDRILASNSLSAPLIDQEIEAVCQTLGILAAAMRASSVNAGEGTEYRQRPF